MKSEKYDRIFRYNREWAEDQNKKDKDFFKKLYSEQNPDFLYIGCSDSRVPPNIITGLDVGDLFVHRNIANIVSGDDLNIQSVIQYAVDHLKVKHIIVCGHYGCAGVKSSMDNNSHGEFNGWLNNIRYVHRKFSHELEHIDNPELKANRLVELNVLEQVDNVIKTAYVQKSYKKKRYPAVHGWVYDMKDGKLHDLNIDFEERLEQVRLVNKID